MITVKEDKEGRFRAGGYDLGMFWEAEIRSAVVGLGIEPLGGTDNELKAEVEA